MNSSLTLRLAMLVGLLGLIQAAAVLGFSYVTLRNELALQQRTALRDRVGQARQLIGTLQDASDLKANAYRLFELVQGQSDLHMAVGSGDSGEAKVAFSREAVESLQRLKQDVWGTDAYLEWEPAGGTTTMLSLASTATTGNGQTFMYGYLARKEEADMELQFGEPYRQYAARTPRFLPRLPAPGSVA